MSPGASRDRPIADSSGPHRQIFAVGHEMRLVVAADDPAARPEHEDAVGGAVDVHAVARRRPRSRRSAGGRRARAARRRACARTAASGLMLVGARVLERVGDRGFGPEQQPRLGGRRAGQALRAAARLPRRSRGAICPAGRCWAGRCGRCGRSAGRRAPATRAAATASAVTPKIDDQRQPAAVIFEPDRAAEQDDQRRQAVGADQRRDADQRRRRRATAAAGFQGKPVNIVPRSHSVIAQAPASTRTQRDAVRRVRSARRGRPRAPDRRRGRATAGRPRSSRARPASPPGR